MKLIRFLLLSAASINHILIIDTAHFLSYISPFDFLFHRNRLFISQSLPYPCSPSVERVDFYCAPRATVCPADSTPVSVPCPLEARNERASELPLHRSHKLVPPGPKLLLETGHVDVPGPRIRTSCLVLSESAPSLRRSVIPAKLVYILFKVIK